MIQTSINRYYTLAGIYNAGLDYTINNISGPPTPENLIDTVYAYINSLGWFSSVPASVMYEIKSVAATAINNYTNNKWGDYQSVQKAFIKRMTVPYFIDNGNLDSMEDLILNLENDIIKSNLSIEAETPLLLATMIGHTTVRYFTVAIASPSSWAPYFAATQASPERNAIYWCQASMVGALIGVRTTPNGMIEKTNDIVSVNIISALTAAITLAIGSVVFSWTPEVEISNNVSMEKGNLLKDPDRIKLVSILNSLNQRISKVNNPDRVDLAVENNSVEEVSALLGYNKMELTQLKMSLISTINNLKLKYPPKNSVLGVSGGQDPDPTDPQTHNCYDLSFGDCKKCLRRKCEDDWACDTVCSLYPCTISWSVACWLLSAYKPSNPNPPGWLQGSTYSTNISIGNRSILADPDFNKIREGIHELQFQMKINSINSNMMSELLLNDNLRIDLLAARLGYNKVEFEQLGRSLISSFNNLKIKLDIEDSGYGVIGGGDTTSNPKQPDCLKKNMRECMDCFTSMCDDSNTTYGEFCRTFCDWVGCQWIWRMLCRYGEWLNVIPFPNNMPTSLKSN